MPVMEEGKKKKKKVVHKKKKKGSSRHSERMKQWNTINTVDEPELKKKVKRKKKRTISKRAEFLAKESTVKKRGVMRRDSSLQRSKRAREKFLVSVGEDKSLKTSVCPRCNKKMYAAELDSDNVWEGEYYHRKCFRIVSGLIEDNPEAVHAKQSNLLQITEEEILSSAKKTKEKTLRKLTAELKGVESQFNLTCPICNDKVLMADDSVWFCDTSRHANCFRCKKCDKRLQAGSYMEHEKEPYCEKCYHEDVLSVIWGDGSAITYTEDDAFSYLDVEIEKRIGEFAKFLRDKYIVGFTCKMLNDHLCDADKILPNFNSEHLHYENFEKPAKQMRLRHDTTREEFEKFRNMLCTDRCNVGLMYFNFPCTEKGGHVSRKCTKLCTFGWFPKHSESKEKILYGMSIGLMHNELKNIGKVFSVSCRNDFPFEKVIEQLQSVVSGTN